MDSKQINFRPKNTTRVLLKALCEEMNKRQSEVLDIAIITLAVERLGDSYVKEILLKEYIQGE